MSPGCSTLIFRENSRFSPGFRLTRQTSFPSSSRGFASNSSIVPPVCNFARPDILALNPPRARLLPPHIINDQVILSRPLEGPLAAHIGSFARWESERGYESQRLVSVSFRETDRRNPLGGR